MVGFRAAEEDWLEMLLRLDGLRKFLSMNWQLHILRSSPLLFTDDAVRTIMIDIGG